MQAGIDYPGVAVAFLCHDGDGRYALNKRSENCRDEHGRWDLGSGSIEFGETVEDALVREVREEYSVDIIHQTFLGVRTLLRTHQGTPTHWIGVDYLVQIPSAIVNGEPHKFDEMAWFPHDALPSPLTSGFPLFLEKYHDQLPHHNMLLLKGLQTPGV